MVQTELTEEHFLPKDPQPDPESSINYDTSLAFTCGLCGSTMRRSAPGGGIGNIKKDIIYSCRNSFCGGKSSAGGSSIRVLLYEDGTVAETDSIGKPIETGTEKLIFDENVGDVINPTNFTVDEWKEPE